MFAESHKHPRNSSTGSNNESVAKMSDLVQYSK
jgi:hypothetical protein